MKNNPSLHTSSAFIGNDIVDLNQESVLEKHLNSRFIGRVLSANEKELIAKAEDPGLFLWYLWSAKEAAFKAIKKFDSSVLFAHRKYDVLISSANEFLIKNDKAATLKHYNLSVSLEWQSTEDYVHCIASLGAIPAQMSTRLQICKTIDVDTTKHTFSIPEEKSIHSDESRAVRSLAKDLLERENITNTQIIRKPEGNQFGPPRIFTDESLLKASDISMSHDGEYIAAFIMV
ncbi:4'-phosphopantetheinyl transferase superfamily protein [bacterium]|nr:4'-phosphopantetheinyl transferase superfamily protein [bacterium]